VRRNTAPGTPTRHYAPAARKASCARSRAAPSPISPKSPRRAFSVFLSRPISEAVRSPNRLGSGIQKVF